MERVNGSIFPLYTLFFSNLKRKLKKKYDIREKKRLFIDIKYNDVIKRFFWFLFFHF